MRSVLPLLCLAMLLVRSTTTAAQAATTPAAPMAPARDSVIRTGLEVFLTEPPAVVRGKRIGLITNHSGIDRRGRSTVDLLHAMADVKLTALFSPEHGIRGVEEAVVSSSTDEKTGLPIHSLYGATHKPTPAMLRDVDVLVFDIQDIGVRQYTYGSTMALAMQAAAEPGDGRDRRREHPGGAVPVVRRHLPGGVAPRHDAR